MNQPIGRESNSDFHKKTSTTLPSSRNTFPDLRNSEISTPLSWEFQVPFVKWRPIMNHGNRHQCLVGSIFPSFVDFGAQMVFTRRLSRVGKLRLHFKCSSGQIRKKQNKLKKCSSPKWIQQEKKVLIVVSVLQFIAAIYTSSLPMNLSKPEVLGDFERVFLTKPNREFL